MARLLPLAIRPRCRAIAVGNTHGLARLCARAGALARIHRAGAAMCSGYRPCAHTPARRLLAHGQYSARVLQPNTAGIAMGTWVTPYVAKQRRTYAFSSSVSSKIAIASSSVLLRLDMTRFVMTSICSRPPAILPFSMPSLMPSILPSFRPFSCPSFRPLLRPFLSPFSSA